MNKLKYKFENEKIIMEEKKKATPQTHQEGQNHIKQVIAQLHLSPVQLHLQA